MKKYMLNENGMFYPILPELLDLNKTLNSTIFKENYHSSICISFLFIESTQLDPQSCIKDDMSPCGI